MPFVAAALDLVRANALRAANAASMVLPRKYCTPSARRLVPPTTQNHDQQEAFATINEADCMDGIAATIKVDATTSTDDIATTIKVDATTSTGDSGPVVTTAIATSDSDSEEGSEEETMATATNSSDSEEEDGEEEATAAAASNIAGGGNGDDLDAFLARLGFKPLMEEGSRESQSDGYVSATRRLELLDWMKESAADAFCAGAPLGNGAFGAVRKIEIGGVAYGLKRSVITSSTELIVMGLDRTGFVQAPLSIYACWEPTGLCEYTLHPLARGSLAKALGLRSTASRQQAEAQRAEQGRLRRALRWLRAKAPGGGCGGSSRDESGGGAIESASKRSVLGSLNDAECCAAFTPIAAEMCAALARLHGASYDDADGLRHGDVKTDSFLVAADGHVRLGDLELICPATEAATPYDLDFWFYAPPEQHPERVAAKSRSKQRPQQPADDAPTDSRSVDVWALGICWLEMLLPDDRLAAARSALHGAKAARVSKKPAAAVAAAATAALAEAHAALLPPGLADLVFGGMLRRDPRARLTIAQVAAHPFFSGIDWAAVGARRAPLPVDLCARLAAA